MNQTVSVSVDFGFVAAMAMEVAPFLDRLSGVRRLRSRTASITLGDLGGRSVALVFAGMGRARAQRGAEALFAGHRPIRLVSAGFGGALDPELKRNDVVLIDEVVNVEGRSFPAEVPILQGLRTKSGRLLTGDAVVRTAAEKAELRTRFGADVVDMETSSVAAFAAEHGIRFHAIRVVSDDATVDLPKEILTIVGETGGVRLGATVGALWKRPSAVFDLWTMRGNAIEASERLSEALVKLVESAG